MLQTVNSESLFLTKASRILTAAGDGAVILEMGKRRGQGRDATVNGAKMAYIAGFSATSNLKAGKKFALPTTGNFAHFYVQFHPDELDAFLHFAEVFPHKTIPVLDTADTLLSGLPNAIRTAKFLEEKGFRMIGVRLDSGDLAYLSKAVRESLDREGLNYVKIAATNDLDEYTITSLKAQGAKIDIWGVGTKFITAFDSPALGGVHKIVARKPFAHEKSDASLAEDWIPLIKISDSLEKVLNPGLKKVYRIYDQHGMAKGDYIALSDENIAGQKEIVLRHPTNPLKTKVVKNFRYEELLHPVFIGGKRTAELPGLDELREYHKRQKATMWEEYLRLDVPEVYPVALSEKLRELKEQLVYKMRGKLRG
jgi:nicotinate phosphoribosyltransferase